MTAPLNYLTFSGQTTFLLIHGSRITVAGHCQIDLCYFAANRGWSVQTLPFSIREAPSNVRLAEARPGKQAHPKSLSRREYIWIGIIGADMIQPMPPYHALFGHLPTMARVSANLPSDLHSHCRPEYVRRTMPGPPPFFYLDPWPFAKPVLVIADPLTAFQVTQGSSPPKHDVVHKFLLAIAGDNSLITLEGKKWKTWRGIFNPGFSTGHLMTLVPGIVEDGLQFCEILQSHAKKGDVFQMEEVATRLTVDVIGRVVL